MPERPPSRPIRRIRPVRPIRPFARAAGCAAGRAAGRAAARAAGRAALLATFFLGAAARADPPDDARRASSASLPPEAAEAALPGAAAPEAPDPVTLDLGLQFGPSFRLGASSVFQVAGRAGPALAVAAAITPSRRFSVGVAYERVGLGSERGGDGDPDWVDVTRSMDALWANLGVHVVDVPRVRLSVRLGAGFVFQHAQANALLSQEMGKPPVEIHCAGSDAVSFAFRAGLGSRFPIGRGVSLLADALFDGVRLGSGPIGGCVLGAGTTNLLSARIGLGYAFDVSRFVR